MAKKKIKELLDRGPDGVSSASPGEALATRRNVSKSPVLTERVSGFRLGAEYHP